MNQKLHNIGSVRVIHVIAVQTEEYVSWCVSIDVKLG